jgi:Big-like domain-containing protein
MRRLFRIAAAALTGASLLSCGGGGDGGTAPLVLTTLSVSFPANTISVGQTASASVVGFDQNGASISTGTISWTTQDAGVATVNASGLVTGVGQGQTLVIATASGNKHAQALVTVIAPVASVTVAPTSAALVVGANRQLTATTRDGNGNVLTGRIVTWGTSNAGAAAVSTSGLVTAVAPGSATITATSEGQIGTSQITATENPCNSSVAIQLAVGELRTLSAAEKASLCLGGGASASEYVLIQFNSSNVAASMVELEVTGTNTTAIQPGSQPSLAPRPTILSGLKQSDVKHLSQESFEWAFRERERRELAPVLAKWKQLRAAKSRDTGLSYLTGIAATPTVGEVVQINADFNTCSSAKQLHSATVVAVLPHTLVLLDNQSPAGGYTGAELTAFGEKFEAEGYPLDVQNFGPPSDVDTNGRIAILFTPTVNAVPIAAGVVLGLFSARDLFPVSQCTASNEGEMFYMPVPDPSSTINSKYTNKENLSRTVLATLVHEFQHLINAGQRFINPMEVPFEEVWLNEGLSHIAEELLYYHVSGNAPRSNIDLALLRSTQEQLDAVNTYQLDNLVRLLLYMESPETNSPFSQEDGLEMRGAIWQLLRYAADRKGGSEQSTWFSLVNTTLAGQANFNAVFGNIINTTRDWAIAQFADDAGLSLPANYSHPSWNFRSVLPAINNNNFPLLTRALLSAPLNITLNGGGAAYLRFGAAAKAPATVAATSAGQPVPAGVEFILIRTQ